MQSQEGQEGEFERQTTATAAAPFAAGNNTPAANSYKATQNGQQAPAATTKAKTAQAAAAAPTTITQTVAKLQMSSSSDDDFNFDSWGGDEIDVTDNNNDDSDEMAERMRQESQKLAQQIVEEDEHQRKEEGERLLRAEEERKKQGGDEADRRKREKMLQEEKKERERLRKLEEEETQRLEEQLRLEQRLMERERRAAEAEERLRKLRQEEEEKDCERLRLEEESKLLIEKQKRLECERKAQEEERLLLLQEEEERELLKVGETRRREEEEAQIERKRLQEEEKERKLMRLEEEAKLLEEERLKSERRADEIARVAEEEEKLKMRETEVNEQERLILLEKESNLLNERQCLDQAPELEVREAFVLENEINKEIENEGMDEGNESISSVTAEEQHVESHNEFGGHKMGDVSDNVEHAEIRASALHDQSEEVVQSSCELIESHVRGVDVRESHWNDSSELNRVLQHSSTDGPTPDIAFFGTVAAELAPNTSSLQSMIGIQAANLCTEASKSTSTFSWEQSLVEDITSTLTSVTTTAVTALKNEPVTEDDGGDDLYDDDDLDAMYDDDESIDSETHDEMDNQKGERAKINGDVEAVGTKIEDESRIPLNSAQHSVEGFVKQLERMSESHQLEMSEMQRSHQIELDRLKTELLLERGKKEKDKARKDVASQDKFLAQMRDLEKKFNVNLKEKEDELKQVMQRNEGMRLKMDSMKFEVDGLIKLVDERDDEIAQLKQGHGKSMVQVEGKVKYGEEELARKDAKVSELKATVTSLQADLDSTTEAYHTLKERAKTIATELKDRRVEVRILASQNQELSSSKTLLENQLTNLRAAVNQHELTIDYKDKDMEALNVKVKELEKQIEGKEKSIQDSSAVGEKAIASYKRKAQEALAAANSRLALANQAREEAEIEAKAAKSASDEAVKRARDAESKMAEAEQRASTAATLFGELKQSSMIEVKDLRDTVDSLRSAIDSMQVEAEEDSNEREKLNVEIGQLRTNLVEVKKKECELREKLIEQQALCTSLKKEVRDLNDEVQRNSAAAFKRANDERSNSENDSKRNTSFLSMDINGIERNCDREEADGTIIMLQQELRGASEAIADLKLALRTALLEKAEGESRDKLPDGNNTMVRGNENTPLFYAIEKQNELNTARDEINRLANMLGDAEAEKQEAYDIMEGMRQKMEEANARLLRFEKLGMKGTRPHQNTSTYGPFRNTPSSKIAVDMHVLSGNDSVVNLEYLKNVILSYLKAKTLADRRKLVPVIATVLCLTPEEQAQAVSSVEESAGLSGVAVSFWENLGECIYDNSVSHNACLLTNADSLSDYLFGLFHVESRAHNLM